MGVEIERKFLVQNTEWRASNPTSIPMRQGYLSVDSARTVRVRQIADQGFVTIKGPSVGAARAEFEYAIPGSDACDARRARLAAHHRKGALPGQIPRKHLEVDVFEGDNAGWSSLSCRPRGAGVCAAALAGTRSHRRPPLQQFVARPTPYNTWPPADCGPVPVQNRRMDLESPADAEHPLVTVTGAPPQNDAHSPADTTSPPSMAMPASALECGQLFGREAVASVIRSPPTDWMP